MTRPVGDKDSPRSLRASRDSRVGEREGKKGQFFYYTLINGRRKLSGTHETKLPINLLTGAETPSARIIRM